MLFVVTFGKSKINIFNYNLSTGEARDQIDFIQIIPLPRAWGGGYLVRPTSSRAGGRGCWLLLLTGSRDNIS